MNHEIDTETYTLIAQDKKNEHLIFLISRRAVIKKFFSVNEKYFIFILHARVNFY